MTPQNLEKRYGAANAIDRDLSTRANTRAKEGVCWFKLELIKTEFILKIIIYYRFYSNWYDPSASCVKDEANWHKCVERDSNVDVAVYQGDMKNKSCGTLQLTYGLEQSDQIYTLICNTEGDTVKLSNPTRNISPCEVVATGPGV